MIKNILNSLILAIIAFVLGGCASASKYQQELDGWIGVEFIRLALK